MNCCTAAAKAPAFKPGKALKDAILGIPGTSSTAAEATQADKAAIDAHNTSIDAVRASENC